MTFEKLLRTYGPTFRWRTFRLYGEPPNGRWLHLAVTQIFGGRTWSVCITRQGPVQLSPFTDAYIRRAARAAGIPAARHTGYAKTKEEQS